MTALSVRGLTVRIPETYGDTPLLDGVSLDLARGETLGIVGESGSGKTLFARAIMGLLPSSAAVTGEVAVQGVDIARMDDDALRLVRGSVIAPVFQDALVALSPTRTVGRHFQDVWRAAKLPRSTWRAAAIAAMERVALKDADRVLASFPHQLSGGMRQRALIALALVREPAILVADEPTTALDKVVEAEVLDTLRQLQAELGLSVILISHDLDVISAVCHRVAVFYCGQLCELGGVQSVLRRPYHRYTEGMVRSVRSLQRRQRPLEVVAGTVPDPRDVSIGCRFLGRCDVGSDQCAVSRRRVAGEGQEAWCNHPASTAEPADRVGEGPR